MKLKTNPFSRQQLIKNPNPKDYGDVYELCCDIEILLSENRRLRKALEWYADTANYKGYGFTEVEIDEGNRARQALAEE